MYWKSREEKLHKLMCEFHNVKGEDWSVSNELHRICKYQGAGNHNEKAEKAKETII